MYDDLRLAGRLLTGARDKVRRYCGLAWSGGGTETWAYRYYDAVETDPNRLDPVDVLTAASLHPGLSHRDLAYFAENVALVESWLSDVPMDLGLADADEGLIDLLAVPLGWPGAPTLTLLSKVLHRKRPKLIPLVDRHVLDWYRPVTGERTAVAAWRPLLKALREDVGDNAAVLSALERDLHSELVSTPSPLRLVDISLWMVGRT